MVRRRSAPLFVMLVLLAAPGCGGGGKDPLVAKVGDREIRASQVREAYLGLKPAERPPFGTLEEKRKFLDDLVDKELMELVAFEKYPKLTPQQETRITRFRERELSDGVKKRLIRSQVVITKEMKDKLYENMKRERLLRGMLILDKDAAEYVKKQLDAGGDFGTLARDYSMQWVSHVNKGEMGWTQPGTLPFAVDTAAWAAPPGSLIGPIPMPMGSYLVEVQDERPAEVTGTREALDKLLEEKLLEPLYLNRQKGVQDSLLAASDPYFPAAGKALLNLKYFWEPPEDQSDNPFAKLDADRVVPTFTAAEETVTVVDFKDAPDWTAKDFAERLSWYPAGLWPLGASEDELAEAMNLVVRDYLFLKAAKDYGLENAEFQKKVEKRTREMRVTFFYYNDVEQRFAPKQAQVDSFFEAHRDAYRAPASYKLAVFGGKDKAMVDALGKEWKAGAEFEALRAKYQKRVPDLVAIGETEWLYEGQDPIRDDLVAPLKEGGVSDPFARADVVMVVKLIASRLPRILGYGEIKEQVDKDAKSAIVDRGLSVILQERRAKYGITIKEKALGSLQIPDAGAAGATAAPGQTPTAPAGG